MVITLRDFNVKVGKTATSTSIGKYGLGKTNERGELLIGFCERHQLTIMNTIFKQPERRLYTWKSPGEVTRNQKDYIMISSRHKNNIKNCRIYPGADIGSDHNPVIANMKVKLKIPKKPKMTPKSDVAALKQPDLKGAYNIEVRNRFSALMGEREIGEKIENPIERINCKWNYIQEAINAAQEKVLPKKKTRSKTSMDNRGNTTKMKERKKYKGTVTYTKLDKEIKRDCIKAKEIWATKKCEKVEELSKDYNQKKCLGSETEGCIKSNDGKIIFETEKILARWTEYVEELFYESRPNNPVQIGLRGPEIMKSEVENCLKQIASGKAPGIDNISSEALQALNESGIETLTELCNENSASYVPADLRTSVFIVLPKKPREL